MFGSREKNEKEKIMFTFYLFGSQKKRNRNKNVYFFTFIPSLGGVVSKRLIDKIVNFRAILKFTWFNSGR